MLPHRSSLPSRQTTRSQLRPRGGRIALPRTAAPPHPHTGRGTPRGVAGRPPPPVPGTPSPAGGPFSKASEPHLTPMLRAFAGASLAERCLRCRGHPPPADHLDPATFWILESFIGTLNPRRFLSIEHLQLDWGGHHGCSPKPFLFKQPAPTAQNVIVGLVVAGSILGPILGQKPKPF